VVIAPLDKKIEIWEIFCEVVLTFSLKLLISPPSNCNGILRLYRFCHPLTLPVHGQWPTWNVHGSSRYTHRIVAVVKLRERSIHRGRQTSPSVRPSVHLSLINAPGGGVCGHPLSERSHGRHRFDRPVYLPVPSN